VSDMLDEGQERWPTSHRPAKSLESSYVTRETMFDKNRLRKVLVALLHLHGVGVWCNKDWVGKMGASNEELMSSLLLR